MVDPAIDAVPAAVFEGRIIFPTSDLSPSISWPFYLGCFTVQSSTKLSASAVDHRKTISPPSPGITLTRSVGTYNAEVIFDQLRGPAVHPFVHSIHPHPLDHASDIVVPVAPSRDYNELQLYTGPGLCEFE